MSEENLPDLLSKCSSEKLDKFFHGMIDSICQQNQAKYQDYSEAWSLEDWWTVTDQSKEICKTCLRNSWSKEEIEENVTQLNDKQKETLSSVISVRKDDLRRSLVENTTAISKSQLQDFDWKVKLAMASDKLGSLQEPLVALDLDINSAKEKKMVSVEMNKEDLKKMITSLEAANRAVQQLKS